MSVEFETLGADDRAAILAEVDRINAIPPGVNTSSPGCAMMLLAIVLFIFGPLVWRRVPSLTIPFFVVEGILLLLGLYWYFRGSGGAYGRTAGRAQEAIETIKSTFPAGQGRQCGEAVARLLVSAYYSDGPGMSTTFNFDVARQQLGPALPFVISLEKFLIAEHKTDPVFTLRDNGDKPAPAV